MTTELAISKLSKIFKDKRWEEKLGADIVFEDFGILLNSLTNEQRGLLIELTERYLWISEDEYTRKIKQLYEKILEDNTLDNISTIYLFPIIKRSDEHKIKSGAHVMYLYKSTKRWVRALENIKIEYIESFKDLNEINFSESDKLFLVDDFIGTGDTLIETLVELEKNKSFSEENTCIFSFVIQKMASEFIALTDMNLYACEIINKGISDFYSSVELENKKISMKFIENKIGKVKRYRFGYKKSEALVTVARTPNNTFPVFWKEYLLKKELQRAPFPRN